jgi:uncharacterized protein with beta-barrel porin domain
VLEIDSIESASGDLAADRLNVGGTATFGATRSGSAGPYGPTVIDVVFEDNAVVPDLEGITVLAADGGLEGRAPHVVLDPASLPNGYNFQLDLEATNLGGTFAGPGEIIPDGAGGAGFVVLQVRNTDPQYATPAQVTAINAPYLVPSPSRAPVLAPSQQPTLVPQAVPVLAPALVKGSGATVTTPVVAPTQAATTPVTGITVQNHGAAVGGTLVPSPQTAQGTNVAPTTVPIGTVSSVVVVEPPAEVVITENVSIPLDPPEPGDPTVVDPPDEVVTTETVYVPADPANVGAVVVDPPQEAVTTEFVSISGSYGAVDQTNARPGARYALVYRPHGVDVAKIPENHGNLAPLGVTQTQTQQQVGTAVTGLLPEPHERPRTTEQAILVSELYPLAVTEINDALDSLAGIGVDPTFVAVMNTRHLQASLDDRLAERRQPGGEVGRASGTGIATWGEILGGYGEGDYLGGSDIRTWGLALGADRDFGNGFVGGVALGYADATISTDDGPGSEVQTAEAALYGSWTGGDWFAGANLGGSHSWIDIGREARIGNARFGLSGDTDARSYFLGAEVGRMFRTGFGIVSPSVGLRYQHLERDGYTETGASGFAREVSDVTLDSLQGILGVRFEGAERGRADSRWRPEIRVA